MENQTVVIVHVTDTSSGEMAALEHPVTIAISPSVSNMITHHMKHMGQVNTGPRVIHLPLQTLSCNPLNCTRGRGYCCSCRGDECSCPPGDDCERLSCVVESNTWYNLYKPQISQGNQSVTGQLFIHY